MIHSQLADAIVVDAITAAVTHIDESSGFVLDHNCYQCGTHALKFFKLLRLIVDREIRQFHRGFQHLIDTVLIHA